MRGLKRSLLLAALLMALLISGCGKREEIAAVEAAVTGYNGFYFEVDDPAGQIEKQEPASDGSAQKIYTLNIRIPDYAALDIGEIPYSLPKIDYENPDEIEYRKSARDALRAAYEYYASTHACADFLNETLRLELNESDGVWTAEISRASENDLLRLLNETFTKILDENEARFTELKLLAIADRKAEILSWIFDDPGLVDAFTITGIDELSDGAYRMHVEYPDLGEVYARLGEKLYASYTAPVFDRVSATLLCEKDDLPGLKTLTRREAEILVRFQGGVAVPEEDNALWKTWYDAKADAEKNTLARLEKDFLIAAKDAPKGGLTSGENRGNLLILNMKKDDRALDCYVRFYRVNADPNEEGTFQLAAYVPAGKRIKLKLPSGLYRAEAHFGEKWYDEEYAFGPGDVMVKTSNTLKSEGGYSLELYLNSLLAE